MKKIGLMGCGTVANYGHLPAIQQTEGLELVSLFDPDPDRLRAAQQQFGVPQAFTDSEAFFNSGLDAIAITSPAPCHQQNVLDAARHGLHALCEKPLATNDAEAEAMIAAMGDAGLMLFTAFCYRFSPAALQIKDLIAQGAIGQLRDLRLIYIWNLHGRYQRNEQGELIENQRRVGRMLEGGPMVDCGVHQIDLARWWTGAEVSHWQAAGAWVEDYDAPDHMYLHLDHESGMHTMVEMSFSYCHTAKEPVNYFIYDLIGTEGVIRYDRGQELFEVRSARGTVRYPWHHEKNFEGMYAAFAQALESGKGGHLPTGMDGMLATRIARAATEQLIAQHKSLK